MLGNMGAGQGLGRIDYEGLGARDARVEAAGVRRVASYFRPYGHLVLAIMGSVLVAARLGVVPPYLMKVIVDEAIPSGDLGRLNWLVASHGRLGACWPASSRSSRTG